MVKGEPVCGYLPDRHCAVAGSDRTVRDNIRDGRLNAANAEVEAAAKAAGCDEFIRALDRGYDTVCGGGGGRLSGGEKQRISITQAMLKDAPIILLDEAAAITPENEAELQAAIDALMRSKNHGHDCPPAESRPERQPDPDPGRRAYCPAGRP